MDGPVPVVPEVVRVAVNGADHMLRCAPNAAVGTKRRCKSSDGIDRDCVLLTLTSPVGPPLGMFTAMTSANALALAAQLIEAADACDAANASPATETVQ